jgi:hypothetical protein
LLEFLPEQVAQKDCRPEHTLSQEGAMLLTKLAITIMFSCTVLGAGPIYINWASTGSAPVLGPPDGATATLGPSVTVGGFSSPTAYAGLEALLGLTPGTMAVGQVLGFDLNGLSSPAGGFESSRWDFTGGVTYFYDETRACGGVPLCVASGSVLPVAYDTFFGTHTGAVVGFVLFGLPVDPAASGFTVTLTSGVASGIPGEGTPDVDAVGVISAAPEPRSGVLVAAAILLCGIRWTLTRRRRPAGQILLRVPDGDARVHRRIPA